MRTAKTDQTAQADLSFRWASISFCWFCHAARHLAFLYIFWLLQDALKDSNEEIAFLSTYKKSYDDLYFGECWPVFFTCK